MIFGIVTKLLKDNNDCNEAMSNYLQLVYECNDVTYPNWETAEC